MSEIPEGATHSYRSKIDGRLCYYKFVAGRAYYWRIYSAEWTEAGAEAEYASCMHQLEPVAAEKEEMTTQELIEALEDLLEAEGVLSVAVAERKARLAIARAKGEGK